MNHIDAAKANAAMASDQRNASDDAAADYFDNLRSMQVEGSWDMWQCRESEEVFKAECVRLGLHSAYLGF
jgi:hypothetical protein